MPQIIIPMITPFKKNEFDIDTLRKFISYAKDNRFDGLFPGGSTGGFASLSLNQHRQVLNEVIERTVGMDLYAGICRNDVEETLLLGRTAIDSGYKNLVCINPYYHKFSERSVENFFEIVLSRLDADIFIYNNPSLSGFLLTPALVSRLKEKHSNLAGMKDSGNDFTLFKEYLKIKGLKVYQGKDAVIGESIQEGAAGGVCSTANFCLNTLNIAKGRGNTEEAAAKTKELVKIVAKYEVPAIHNYLFRKLILRVEVPSGYVNEPFVDLDPLPDLQEFRKNVILPS